MLILLNDYKTKIPEVSKIQMKDKYYYAYKPTRNNNKK